MEVVKEQKEILADLLLKVSSAAEVLSYISSADAVVAVEVRNKAEALIELLYP